MSSDDNRIMRLIAKLRELLVKHGGNGLPLAIADDAYVEEDNWVYLIVSPAKAGVRAYEYVERLGELERELRDAVNDQRVLLVPAAPD